MIQPTIHRYGTRALLLEWHGDDDLTAMHAPAAFSALVRRNDELMRHLVEVVPGARTVLLVCDRLHVDTVMHLINEFCVGDDDRPHGRHHNLDVTYDGDDLAMVAAEVSCSIDDVIQMHSTPTYRVAFCGFSPGFGYLSGLDSRLRLPRRPSPRTTVPAGSVAIAGEYSAVYPSASPGGWHLLGRTSHLLWDVRRSVPALLQPGDTVRFVPRGMT
jgi:KipI family sensor histidine kinase inhibitor